MPFFNVLQQLGIVLLHSALIGGHFAAFCLNLLPFCRVLQRNVVLFLRSACIWCRFATFCHELRFVSFVPHEFAAVLLRSASCCRFASCCVSLRSFCFVLKRFGVVLLHSVTILGVLRQRYALTWDRFAAFCIDLVFFF